MIAEDLASFRKGESRMEQIYNLRVLLKKYSENHLPIHSMFIDCKKAFDRVRQEALWNTMSLQHWKQNNKSDKVPLQDVPKCSSHTHNTIVKWFLKTVGLRQECLLSPFLFNVFLERLMQCTLQNQETTVKTGGRKIAT